MPAGLFGLPTEAAIAMSLIKRVPDVVFGAPSLLGWQMLEGWTLFAVDDPRIRGRQMAMAEAPVPAPVRSTARAAEAASLRERAVTPPFLLAARLSSASVIAHTLR